MCDTVWVHWLDFLKTLFIAFPGNGSCGTDVHWSSFRQTLVTAFTATVVVVQLFINCLFCKSCCCGTYRSWIACLSMQFFLKLVDYMGERLGNCSSYPTTLNLALWYPVFYGLNCCTTVVRRLQSVQPVSCDTVELSYCISCNPCCGTVQFELFVDPLWNCSYACLSLQVFLELVNYMGMERLADTEVD